MIAFPVKADQESDEIRTAYQRTVTNKAKISMVATTGTNYILRNVFASSGR